MPEPAVVQTPRVIAIANQKGGVGKTTTAMNLAAALAERGARILVLDLDPQGNASTGLGIDASARHRTTYDLISQGISIREVAQRTSTDGVWLCPATTDLSSIDMELGVSSGRSGRLAAALDRRALADLGFDMVLIDCPPSLSLLTVNAMVAADSVLVPLQAEFFALEGLSQLMLTVREVRTNANPRLRIEGIVLTMYDGRNKLSQLVEHDARETLGDLVFRTVVPRNVRVSEAPSYALPVLAYDSASRGAQAYRALADEILARHAVANQREERA